MTYQEKIKAYEAKLNMIGKNTDGLFKVDQSGVSVDVLKLVEALNYPDALQIPSFVSSIGKPPYYGMDSVFKNIPPDERTEHSVKKVVFNDGLRVADYTLGVLKEFYNAKTISLTEQQYEALKRLSRQDSFSRYSFEVRK